MYILLFVKSRPGRLTDGPYTSYDLNTLIKATAGKSRAAVIGQGEPLIVLSSRVTKMVLNMKKINKRKRITDY